MVYLRSAYRRTRLISLIAVLYLISSSLSFAADSVGVAVYDVSTGLLIPNGDTLDSYGQFGELRQFELRISIANDTRWYGMSLGFRMTSPDGESWAWLARPEPAYGEHNYVTVFPGSRMDPVTTVWDFGFLITEKNIDGLGCDSLLLGGVANAGGLPAGEAQEMMAIRFSLKNIGDDQVRSLEIDSCKVGDGGDWCFADSMGAVFSPTFSGRLHFATRSMVVAVDEVRAMSIKSFSLHQNSPNPFNPVTQIVYDLPKQARVKLEVYNILGQQVKVLVDQTQVAGSYRVTWDGSDANGGAAASGIYFYRIRAGEYESNRKMILLK